MKKWFEQFKTEDWVVVAVSILLLAFAIITPDVWVYGEDNWE